MTEATDQGGAGVIDEVPDMPASHELDLPAHETVELTHGTVEVRGPLLDRQETAKQTGWNGVLVARITLPGDSNDPRHKLPKELGIIDFGDFDPANPPTLLVLPTGEERNYIGRAESRFGVGPLNYTPEDHLRAFVALPQPGHLEIGKDPTQDNYTLGLDEGNDQVGRISAQHVTLTMTPDQRILITDHSVHGTTVDALTCRPVY